MMERFRQDFQDFQKKERKKKKIPIVNLQISPIAKVS